VLGGAGDDELRGGPAADRLAGGAGNDVLTGMDGDDVLDGGPGTDIAAHLSLNDGRHVVVDLAARTATGFGTDTLVSVEGAGGQTEDVDDSPDVLLGDGGANVFIDIRPGDRVDGRGGSDTVDYRPDIGLGGGTRLVNLARGFVQEMPDLGGRPPRSRLVSIENAHGSEGPDTLVGTDGPNLLDGFSGNDVIRGGGGPDRLFGGDGADRLFGGAGSDRLAGGPGSDANNGGTGADRCTSPSRGRAAVSCERR